MKRSKFNNAARPFHSARPIDSITQLRRRIAWEDANPFGVSDCVRAFGQLGSLILQRVDPYFRAMVGASWNSQVKTVEALPSLSEMAGSARPDGSLNFGEKLVVIGHPFAGIR